MFIRTHKYPEQNKEFPLEKCVSAVLFRVFAHISKRNVHFLWFARTGDSRIRISKVSAMGRPASGYSRYISPQYGVTRLVNFACVSRPSPDKINLTQDALQYLLPRSPFKVELQSQVAALAEFCLTSALGLLCKRQHWRGRVVTNTTNHFLLG